MNFNESMFLTFVHVSLGFQEKLLGTAIENEENFDNVSQRESFF